MLPDIVRWRYTVQLLKGFSKMLQVFQADHLADFRHAQPTGAQQLGRPLHTDVVDELDDRLASRAFQSTEEHGPTHPHFANEPLGRKIGRGQVAFDQTHRFLQK